ncbi:MAG TPA: CRTAC1 family protein, partial [Terriglobia bacterium]|nr:CRTAC1 family protein [Terriglobia bacterium]
LPETMSAGALFFDYDNDGWLDIFLVNGGSFSDATKAARAQHRLYRNTGGRTYRDVSASSGIEVSGFGMGGCSADYDNDGWADLYVTGVGGNRLFHNTGKNGFADVTSKAGVAAGMWSSSCAFGDIDNDGYVDLYVTRYVDFTPENNKYCRFDKLMAYCHPNVYSPLHSILYRNNGDGTFTDNSRQSGIGAVAGNGLGVVFGDYDNDGWSDIYVANDSTPSFLFHNKGAGVFEEVGLRAGVAVGTSGKPLAGMGTDMGDIEGDGLLDIFVTNLSEQTHSLYRNLGKGLFDNITFPSGVGKATLPFVGFGTAFFDYDNDMDLDLAVVNGDVIDNIDDLKDQRSYKQLNLLLQNDGSGKFKEVGAVSGPGFALKKASRALAVGDIDNDGDLDLLIANAGDTADLLRNDGGNRENSLLIRTVGSKSNQDGIGARLKLTIGRKVLLRYVKAGSSYLAQNDLRVHFGLGNVSSADRLEILWPSGVVDVLRDIATNQIVTVREGEGIVSQKQFEASRAAR